jgi:murein DD-endopeptidase MepM/ murein hydrolase activator NlpD
MGGHTVPQEEVFELVHSCVGKEQGWIAFHHKRGWLDYLVAFGLKKVQKSLPYFGSSNRSGFHGLQAPKILNFGHMARPRYEFNPIKLVYEQVRQPWTQRLLTVLGYFSAAVVSSVLVITLAYTFLDSPKEKKLLQELDEMSLKYKALDQKVQVLQEASEELRLRDRNIYRVIFEADPLPTPKEDRKDKIDAYAYLASYRYGSLMATTALKTEALGRELLRQSQSYQELTRLIRNKSQLMEALPAIQPMALSGRRRGELVSGYGYRMDPIYKTVKFHEGIDLIGPLYAPVYATGDGKVREMVRMDRGYGNYLLLDHGYGYQTLYAHLSRFEVRPGQRVKRGQMIGRLGNTGKSTGPHLHYEVVKNGRKVDPVYYIFNDLNPQQHSELVARASSANQSLD